MSALDAEIRDLLRFAAERAILPRYRNLATHDVEEKAADDFVTVADRETELFLTEALTRLGPDGVPDPLYAAVREHFSDRALTFLTLRVMMINGWNRLNVAFRTAPGVRDKDYGLDKAGLA